MPLSNTEPDHCRCKRKVNCQLQKFTQYGPLSTKSAGVPLRKASGHKTPTVLVFWNVITSSRTLTAAGVDPDSAIDLVELPKLARVSSKSAGVTLREANSRKLPDPSPGLGAPPAFRARASSNKLLSPFAGTVVQGERWLHGRTCVHRQELLLANNKSCVHWDCA